MVLTEWEKERLQVKNDMLHYFWIIFLVVKFIYFILLSVRIPKPVYLWY